MKPVSILDYRALARMRLRHFLFAYIEGGEVTPRRNPADLARIALPRRVLCDVSKIDLSMELSAVARRCPLRRHRSVPRTWQAMKRPRWVRDVGVRDRARHPRHR